MSNSIFKSTQIRIIFSTREIATFKIFAVAGFTDERDAGKHKKLRHNIHKNTQKMNIKQMDECVADNGYKFKFFAWKPSSWLTAPLFCDWQLKMNQVLHPIVSTFQIYFSIAIAFLYAQHNVYFITANQKCF